MTPEILPDGKRILLPHEACELLRVTSRWLRENGKNLPGRIEYSKRTIRYREDALLAWQRVCEKKQRTGTG